MQPRWAIGLGRLGAWLVVLGVLAAAVRFGTAHRIELGERGAVVRPDGSGEVLERLGGRGARAIVAHPPSRYEWSLDLRSGRHRLTTDLGIREGAWALSDGARFRVSVVEAGRRRVVGERTLVPRGEPRWSAWELAFETHGPARLVLETLAADPSDDWCLWGHPTLHEAADDQLGWTIASGGLVLLAVLAIALRRGARRRLLLAAARPVLFAVSLVALVLAAEGLLAVRPTLRPIGSELAFHEDRVATMRDGPQYLYERELGYRPLPSSCWVFRPRGDLTGNEVDTPFDRSDQARVRVCTDRVGFRNERPGPYRTVVVGDSFVWNGSLPIEQGWTEVAARELGEPVGNFGVPGYAPEQSLVVLRRYALDVAREIVVFTIYLGNDLRDAANFERYRRSGMSWAQWGRDSWAMTAGNLAYSRYQDSYLGSSLDHVLRGSMAPSVRSDLQGGACARLNPFCPPELGGPCMAWSSYQLSQLAMDASEWERHEGFLATLAAVRDARRIVEARGLRMVVLVFPSKERVYWRMLARSLDLRSLAECAAREGADPARVCGAIQRNLDVRRRLFIQALSDEGIEHFDLTPVLERHARAGTMVFDPYDTHPGAAGNAIVGRVVAGYLRRPR